MADETRGLAKFAAQLTYDQIPPHVRALAANLLVDQIGVQIGCSELPWARQVRDTHRKAGGTPQATVVRYGDRLPAGAAAFINSTFGHSFEFDDGNPVTHGHLGAELIAPLLAIAEREHVSGRSFLAALVAAYEIRGRIGWATSPGMMERGGPQYMTTFGPFGVAAGVAKLLGLDVEGIRNAMGIAGGYSGGLMQYDHGGGSVKRVYPAIAGQSGMQSAHLARAGMTGPEEILEGARGLLRIYSSEFLPERLVAEFGTKWMLQTVKFKPYCCCGIIHPAIDGLTRIIQAHHLKAEDIAAIDVANPTGFHEHAGITDPHDLLGMQFSTSFSLALTVLKGSNTPRIYTLEALADPAIRSFASRVQVRADAGLDHLIKEGHLPARVGVRTRSGAYHEEMVVDAKGSLGAPLSADDLDAKFRSQVADILGAQRCDQSIRALRTLEALDDMASLLPMLVAQA